jgi:hypothetical protein
MPGAKRYSATPIFKLSESIMSLSRLSPLFIAALLISCGGGEDPKDDTAGGDDTAPEVETITPTEGNYSVYNSSFSEDNCDAAANLTEPTDFDVTDVAEGSFMYRLLDGPLLLGMSQCAEGETNAYTCDTLNTGFDISVNATMSIAADGLINLIGTGSFEGAAVLTVDCTGSGCDLAALNTPKGFPCTTTWNYEAAIEE